MKKQIHIFVALLAILFITISASAQGEWKWANCWSGTGGNPTDYYNSIVKTSFDEEGNIYVFGQMAGQLTFNGSPFMFISNPQVYGSTNRSSLLAKFDTLGNMLWYKVVKSSESVECYPFWMEVKDDKVFISGNLSLDDVDNYTTVGEVWLYYFDTLITGQQVHAIPAEQRIPPYKSGRYTYFATFDLNGNLLDNHFVASFSRKIYTGGLRAEYGLCQAALNYSPFHIDRDGNTFVYAKLSYEGLESDPYTLIVDGDTNKKYDIYLPGNVEPYGRSLFNVMMYKFSPDWELLYAKPMVHHTEGVATSWELSYDSVNTHYVLYIQGMSFDEDDNMYISGYLSLELCGDNGGDLHQYPIHIYWDSTNYSTIQDITSSNLMGYIVKYNINGEVQWSNQIFTRGNDYVSARASFAGCCMSDGNIFVLGQGSYKDEGNGLVYFDEESNPLQRYQQSTTNQTFFVRYNAQTGSYLNQGVVPAINALTGLSPTVLNNRVFSCANILPNRKIYQWDKEGEFIQAIDFNVSGSTKNSSVLANNQGNLLYSVNTTASISFANGVSAYCPAGQSSAVFALYHDPEFATPYVGISEYDGPKPEVRLWPNPATDKITIESEEEFPIVSVSVADMQGTILALLPVNDVRCTLNVHNLAPGTYIAHVQTKAGVSDVKFVVVRN